MAANRQSRWKRHLLDSVWAVKAEWADVRDTCASSSHFFLLAQRAQEITEYRDIALNFAQKKKRMKQALLSPDMMYPVSWREDSERCLRSGNDCASPHGTKRHRQVSEAKLIPVDGESESCRPGGAVGIFIGPHGPGKEPLPNAWEEIHSCTTEKEKRWWSQSEKSPCHLPEGRKDQRKCTGSNNLPLSTQTFPCSLEFIQSFMLFFFHPFFRTNPSRCSTISKPIPQVGNLYQPYPTKCRSLVIGRGYRTQQVQQAKFPINSCINNNFFRKWSLLLEGAKKKKTDADHP